MTNQTLEHLPRPIKGLDLRNVFYVIGFLLAILGVSMLIPALADLAVGNAEWTSFIGAASLTLFVGISLVLMNKGELQPLTVHQTFLLTTVVWIAAAACGALPFAFSSYRLSYTDSFFEAMSGLSTTGGTIIVGLDRAPPGLLLWRSLLNWIGGVGIVAMAILVFPFLRVGGMQLFRTESSERGDKPYARLHRLAAGILTVYLLLTALSALGFHFAGMSGFDAVNHAMAAIATGGFSTKDSSLGFYGGYAIPWVAIVSMIAGALPLTWYLRNYVGARLAFFGDSQVVALLGVLLVTCTSMTLWVVATQELSWAAAATHATVNVVSIITDTGFVSTDYGGWGSFAVGAFFFFYFIGGCTGSTAGSIKIFRWQVLFGAIANQIRRMLAPHRVLVQLYHGRSIGTDVMESVINFVVAYILCFTALSLALMALGNDLLTSFSAVAACLAGAGPGLGTVVGPAGTYAPLSDVSKWLLSLAMLLGRLEVFTVLVLLSPAYWKD